MKCWTLLVVAALSVFGARAQSFPFSESFTSYTPGSTGAPAWSILDGALNAADGALHGPVTLRYNGRPPARFTAEAVVRLAPDAAEPLGAAGFVFDMQHEADTGASDAVFLEFARDDTGAPGWRVATRPAAPASAGAAAPLHALAPADGPLRLRLVVDATEGRCAVFVGDEVAVSSAPLEYPAGLIALRVQGAATMDDLVIRPSTPDEQKALAVHTLFNDPRDLAAGDGGNFLVLHRSSPAVLVVTPDGEVTRRFGRRQPDGVPDPVALARSPTGGVLVLNRFPAEVVAYNYNGGIRYRFGRGRLVEPADIAVRANGTIYVADPGARKIFAFDATGRALGEATPPGSGTPTRIAVDALDNLVVSLDHGARAVVLRPAADSVTMSLLQDVTPAPSDLTVVANGATWGLEDGRVFAWPRISPDAPAFTGSVVGGLDPRGRLASSGERVAALERSEARIVLIPANLQDTQPTVTMQNVADTAAIVRWESAEPGAVSRVRLLRGETWDTVTDRNAKPDTKRQVLVERLIPGRTYTYRLSPTVGTIPPSDWSAPFTFTAGTEKEAP